MAASHQQRYRQRRRAQGFKEVTVSLDASSQARLHRMGQAYGKTRQEVRFKSISTEFLLGSMVSSRTASP